MTQSGSIGTAIATSLALIDQFISSLDTLANTPQPQAQPSDHPSPLHLLAASVTSLKSSVTKISLLTITKPFTASAVASTVQPLNTSILPSLVTATLLTSPAIYPESFARECTALTKATLRDLKSLLSLTKTRSEDGKPKNEVGDSDKKSVTEATGKLWEDIDLLLRFSNGGVAGFVFKKATQWLDLMKDAVKEFEEWDPEDEIGDDPFGLDETQSDEEDEDETTKEKDTDRVAMSAGVKDQALKVLSRVPQSIHVVVKQRLEKMPKETAIDSNTNMSPMPPARKETIDKVLKKTRQISDCIDESAEAMYMGNVELCLKMAGEARALTIEVVEAVLQPWESSGQDTKEDQYIKRALTWIQQVEPGGRPVVVAGNDKGKVKA